jgi:hypothetical protein
VGRIEFGSGTRSLSSTVGTEVDQNRCRCSAADLGDDDLPQTSPAALSSESRFRAGGLSQLHSFVGPLNFGIKSFLA